MSDNRTGMDMFSDWVGRENDKERLRREDPLFATLDMNETIMRAMVSAGISRACAREMLGMTHGQPGMFTSTTVKYVLDDDKKKRDAFAELEKMSREEFANSVKNPPVLKGVAPSPPSVEDIVIGDKLVLDDEEPRPPRAIEPAPPKPVVLPEVLVRSDGKPAGPEDVLREEVRDLKLRIDRAADEAREEGKRRRAVRDGRLKFIGAMTCASWGICGSLAASRELPLQFVMLCFVAASAWCISCAAFALYKD